MKKVYCSICCGLLLCHCFAQVSVRTSNGSQFVNYIGNRPWTGTVFYGTMGTYFADVDGDGKADAIAVNTYGVTVLTSTGRRFFNFLGNAPWTEAGFYGSKVTAFADVNGDGKADAIAVNDNAVVVRLSNGNKFLPNAIWTDAPYFGSRGTYFADVNGDGKADAIVVNENAVVVRVSDGTRFLPNATWTQQPYYGSRGSWFADVNGDKKADAIVVNDGGVTVRLSDGTQFLPNTSWTANPYYGTRGTYFADVNADGKSDAIVVNENATTVRLSDGTRFLPNATWLSTPFYGSRASYFADVNGDKKADALALNGPVNLVTRRIAGSSFYKFVKSDSKDWWGVNNGFLLATHNPGCGIVGNDGADLFFGAAGLSLPAGCSINSTEFSQFWPTERGFDSPWSWLNDAGSYGAQQQTPFERIRWHNACTGAYSGKELKYIISFVVSMPDWMQLGEPTFDPSEQMIRSFTPPTGFGWMQVPPPVPDNNGTKKPQPTLFPFYFKVTCGGAFTSCSPWLQWAVDQQSAQKEVERFNGNCTVEKSDAATYSKGNCN